MGDENPLCTPAVSDLPGYSKVLYLCPVMARYITVEAPGSAALDICMLSTFLQSTPHSPLSKFPSNNAPDCFNHGGDITPIPNCFIVQECQIVRYSS